MKGRSCVTIDRFRGADSCIVKTQEYGNFPQSIASEFTAKNQTAQKQSPPAALYENNAIFAVGQHKAEHHDNSKPGCIQRTFQANEQTYIYQLGPNQMRSIRASTLPETHFDTHFCRGRPVVGVEHSGCPAPSRSVYESLRHLDSHREHRDTRGTRVMYRV